MYTVSKGEYMRLIDLLPELHFVGVSARAKTTMGAVHCSDLMMMSSMPDVFYSAMTDVVSFANSL
jgi:hypothetical protein